MLHGRRDLIGFAVSAFAIAVTARAAGEDATLSSLSLDATFGDGGSVTQIGRGAVRLGFASAVAIDGQGRLVVAGGLRRSPTDDFYRGIRPGVARLLPDGRLDPTFGRRGVSLLPLGGELLDVALDGEGRILVAGTFRRLGALRGVRTATYQVARLRGDGRLDLRFSGDGLVSLPRRLGWVAHEVREAPDGSLRLLTERATPDGVQYGIVRASRRGELPRGTFGDDGFVHVGTALAAPIEDPVGGGSVSDIAVRVDGGTLVATEGGVRLVTAGGERDASFGGGGFASKTGGGAIRGADAVRLDAEGRILFVGIDDSFVTAVFRADSSGFVDPSYGTGGGAEFLHALPTDTARPFSFLMDVEPATGACALATQLEYFTDLGTGIRNRGRFAGALDLDAPAAVETFSREDEDPLPTLGLRTAILDVAIAPDGRSLVVVGSLREPDDSRPRPLVERITREGATPLPRTNLRIAFDSPPTVELDAELDRWFLVTPVRLETTEPVASRGVRLSLYTSDDDVFDSGDSEYVRLNFLPVPANGGASATIRRDVLGAQHGPTVMAGKRLLAVADGDDRLLETDETDNVVVSAAFE